MATKEPLLWGLLSGFLIGFVYMIVLRLCGGPIIYASIVAMILGTAYGGWMLYQTSEAMPTTDKYKPYYLYGSYVVWGIAGILFCCICFNLKNIRIGVAVMKCTAAFIGGTPQVFLAPPVSIVILLAWLFAWIAIASYIVSIGEVKPRADLPFLTTVVRTNETTYMFLYSLFGYLWLNAFIIGCTQFIISAACAIWYFTSTSDSNGSGSLIRGLWWVFRYHLGSIAFGAFLIALVQFIRIIFEYYKSKVEKLAKGNPIVKVLLWCTSYMLMCLERFIKFISKNAYIQVSLFQITDRYLDRYHRKEFLRFCLECLPSDFEECSQIRNCQLDRLHLQRAWCCLHLLVQWYRYVRRPPLLPSLHGTGLQLDHSMRYSNAGRLHHRCHVHERVQFRKRHHPAGLHG